MKTGLTNRTVKNMQLNAGVLLSSYTKGGEINESNILCATRGGGSFTAVPDIHQAAVDGAPTNTKGLQRIDGWTVTLNATAVELSPEIIKRAIGFGAKQGSESSPNTGDVNYTADTKISLDDYKDVYWVGDLSDGRNIVIHLKNAVNTGGFNLSFSDKGEGTFPLTLVANYDANDIVDGDWTAPFKIIIEGEND